MIRRLLALTACSLPLFSYAQPSTRVSFETTAGRVSAYYAAPTDCARCPAVVYFHGLLIEQVGDEEAARRGYSVKAFVESLAQEGYAALAPLREAASAKIPPAELVRGALAFLSAKGSSPSAVGLIGFSKGGAAALAAAAAESNRVDALVLMSPSQPDLQLSLRPAVPLLITLGQRDPKPVQDAGRALFRRMNREGRVAQLRDRYPGDHQWFWQPRPEYWGDVLSFLRTALEK